MQSNCIFHMNDSEVFHKITLNEMLRMIQKYPDQYYPM